MEQQQIVILAVMAWAIFAIICGALTAEVAGSKGRVAANWFWLGFFTNLLGLIAAAGLATGVSSPADSDTDSSRSL